MIVGELIGIIASISIWVIFFIGVIGLNKEFGKEKASRLIKELDKMGVIKKVQRSYELT